MTAKGERVMMPEFGSIIWDYLYEPLDETNKQIIEADAKEIRLSMLKGEKHKACQVCWNKEDVGVTSKRQTSNRWYNWFNLEKAKQVTNEDGSTSVEPVYWDLRFGNLCNLKCVMCHPASSSQWYEDYILVEGGNSYYDNGKKITLDRNKKGRLVATNGTYDWHESDDFWTHMETKIPYLEQVYLVGGEPIDDRKAL